MNYSVLSYFIEDINDNQAYVMNTENIVKIVDLELIQLLHWIDNNNLHLIPDSDIRRFMGNKSTKAINFLKEKKIFITHKDFTRDLSRTIYITNDDSICKMISFLLLDDNPTPPEKNDIKFIKEIEFIENKLNFNKKNIYFFLLNPFNISKLKQIVKLSQMHKVCIRVAFLYNFKFYITNLYSPLETSPCPMCFFYNLESSLRTTDRFSNSISFQNIVDMIYNENEKFTSAAKLSRRQLLPIISFINSLENVRTYNDVYEMDYNTGNAIQDIAFHWELCDCYE